MNNGSYNPSMCENVVLEKTGRALLADKAAQLFKCLVKATSDYKGLCTTSTQFDVAFVDVATARTVFDDAKVCVSVIAHVRTLQTMKGAAQVAEAKQLLAVPCGAPLTLTNAIKNICAAESALTESAKRRKK